MSSSNDEFGSVDPTRRIVGVALVLAAAALAGCGTSTWLEQKKYAPVVFTHAILPIMVFRSDYVMREDHDGISDAVATALVAALGDRGIQTTVVELAGAPRSPRVELALWNLEPSAHGTVPSITVDCAYVSPGEKVAFVGRLRVESTEQDLASTVESLAQGIVDKLSSLT